LEATAVPCQVPAGTNGNFGSTIVDHVAGTNTTLESQGTFFQQDLNGDSRIGVVTVVEQSGSTKLDLFANAYFFDPAGGTGPSLKYNGLPVFPGQFGTLAPIGAEKTASGYEVAWKVSGADQYSIWITDANGNYASTIVDNVAGTDTTLESQESFFQQDLNGDGHVGAVTVIEQSGSTKLDLFANN
jgi:hypothetical protein